MMTLHERYRKVWDQACEKSVDDLVVETILADLVVIAHAMEGDASAIAFARHLATDLQRFADALVK